MDWKYPSPYQLGAAERQAFAKDTWGGTFHDDFQVRPDDIVVTEHWGSSGFPNTDLEHKLKRYGKEKIICIGLLANTCLEATARIGMELGFHVTLVRDATAARSHEALHAMLDIDGPTFAHEIVTTAELVSVIRRSARYDRILRPSHVNLYAATTPGPDSPLDGCEISSGPSVWS